jgi:hypothetical protein
VTAAPVIEIKRTAVQPKKKRVVDLNDFYKESSSSDSSSSGEEEGSEEESD